MSDFEEGPFDTLWVFLVTAIICGGIWFFGFSKYPKIIVEFLPFWIFPAGAFTCILLFALLDYFEKR